MFNMILAIAVLAIGGFILYKNKGVHPDVFELVEGEEIIEIVKGDYWEKSFLGRKQKSGELAITNKRVLFKGTMLVSCLADVSIYYSDMDSIKPSMSPPCFPFGITITTKEGSSYLFAVLKRKHYFELINSVATKS